jgi:hypothetical protein
MGGVASLAEIVIIFEQTQVNVLVAVNTLTELFHFGLAGGPIEGGGDRFGSRHCYFGVSNGGKSYEGYDQKGLGQEVHGDLLRKFKMPKKWDVGLILMMAFID